MDNIGVWLRALDNRILRHMEHKFRELDHDIITGTNSWILLYLFRNAHRDVYQRELEEEFGITRSTVSKVAKLMEQKGLIRRCMDENDARKLVIRLTDKALNIASEMDAARNELNARLLSGFEREEIEKLDEYMGRMLRNMCKEDE